MKKDQSDLDLTRTDPGNVCAFAVGEGMLLEGCVGQKYSFFKRSHFLCGGFGVEAIGLCSRGNKK